MHFGFRQGDRHPEHPAMATLRDADRHQHGTVDQLAAFAHPLIAGIEKDIRRFIERPLTPDGQAGVQLFGRATDLRRRN
jgi:hypothetical protein